MTSNIDKSKIIEAVNNTEDERILFAINRLLQIDEDQVPEWHKQALNERSDKIKRGEEEFYDWEKVKEEIKKID